MSRLQIVVLACAFLFSAVSSPALANDLPPALSGDELLLQRMAQKVRRRTPLKEVLEEHWRMFRDTDIDGGGVSERDYESIQQLGEAKRRASFLRQWIERDLNGDGDVSRAELEIVFAHHARNVAKRNRSEVDLNPEQVAKIAADKVAEALVGDADKDGIVTYQEMLELAANQPTRRRPTRKANRPIPLSLDADGDGRVSEDEYGSAIDRAMGVIDSDGDGEISEAEKTALTARLNENRKRVNEIRRLQRIEAKNREIAEACQFPAVLEDAEIVFVSAYEGAALSTLAIGGDDAEVTVIDVRIEPGEVPLYVLVSSHDAVLWRFSGALDRVIQVAANSTRRLPSGAARVGVTGVAAERVHFANQRQCLGYLTDPGKDRNAAATVGMVRFLLGRPADHLASAYELAAVSLPGGEFSDASAYSGKVDLYLNGPGEVVWRETKVYYPGGLVATEIGSVVSPAPAGPYGVLPTTAGLAQLLDAGLLRIAKTSSVFIVNGTKIFTGGGRDTVRVPDDVPVEVKELPTAYLITGKITFPAGLHGAYSTLFLLPHGVPEPEGSPGHSKVLRTNGESQK